MAAFKDFSQLFKLGGGGGNVSALKAPFPQLSPSREFRRGRSPLLMCFTPVKKNSKVKQVLRGWSPAVCRLKCQLNCCIFTFGAQRSVLAIKGEYSLTGGAFSSTPNVPLNDVCTAPNQPKSCCLFQAFRENVHSVTEEQPFLSAVKAQKATRLLIRKKMHSSSQSCFSSLCNFCRSRRRPRLWKPEA